MKELEKASFLVLLQFQGEGRFSSPFQFPLGHLGDKESQHAFKEGMLTLSPRVIRSLQRSLGARAPRGRSSGPHPRARAARSPLQEGPVVTGGQDPDGRGWGAGCGGRGVPGQLPIEEQLRASPESCVVVPDDPVGFK